jgi:hypothetical protein
LSLGLAARQADFPEGSASAVLVFKEIVYRLFRNKEKDQKFHIDLFKQTSGNNCHSFRIIGTNFLIRFRAPLRSVEFGCRWRASNGRSLLDFIGGRQGAGTPARTPDGLVSQGFAIRGHANEYQQHGHAGKQMQVHRILQRP